MKVRTPAALLLGATVLFGACSLEVLHDLEEPEANDAVLCLERRGIPVDKLRSERGGRARYAVSVPRSEGVAALSALGEAGLPRPRGQGVGDLLGGSPLLSSSQKERVLLERAVAGELARTLQAVDGVVEARVHLVVPERDPLAAPEGEATRPRASALLRTTRPRLGATAAELRRLVAGAVAGLSEDAVSLVVVEARPASAPAASSSSPVGVARLGPFLVARESRGLLLASVSGSLLLLVLLGVGTIVLFRRNQVLLRLPRPPAGPPEGGPAA
jgi:type III secretion protein J